MCYAKRGFHLSFTNFVARDSPTHAWGIGAANPLRSENTLQRTGSAAIPPRIGQQDRVVRVNKRKEVAPPPTEQQIPGVRAKLLGLLAHHPNGIRLDMIWPAYRKEYGRHDQSTIVLPDRKLNSQVAARKAYVKPSKPDRSIALALKRYRSNLRALLESMPGVKVDELTHEEGSVFIALPLESTAKETKHGIIPAASTGTPTD